MIQSQLFQVRALHYLASFVSCLKALEEGVEHSEAETVGHLDEVRNKME